MKTKKIDFIPLLVTIILCFLPSKVLADGEEFRAPEADNSQLGADAQIDHRLPPVLPGEEVNDGGKKIKMWSTSGSVSTGKAPEPWRDEKQIPNLSNGVGVVIDGRQVDLEPRRPR